MARRRWRTLPIPSPAASALSSSRSSGRSSSAAAAPASDGGNPSKEVPVVEYDVSKLPDPVKQLRDKIIAAAVTGDPEKLRPLVQGNGPPPQLSLNDIDDPIQYLKSQSGDSDG